MRIELEVPLAWVRGGGGVLGGAGLLFGIFTALFPRQSIALYAWLMARINWRVTPIDEAHELRMTRILGTLLGLLSLALIYFSWLRPI